jgi:hypothetical protein
MPDKPTTAAGYRPEFLEHVRATCLYVATKLGDLMDDMVVVGGLVPSLLIDQEQPVAGVEAHVGTLDLDVGLALAVLEEERYQALTERLRRAGLSPDRNEQNNPTRQRWRLDGPHPVTIDFLIPPSRDDDRGGTLRDIEPDFAAVITPGLRLAFVDRARVTLAGKTIAGEDATRDVWVCGAGAFVVLKALAFHMRGENKDAYDLYYVIRSFGDGPASVTARLRPILGEPEVQEALSILGRDFSAHGDVGPLRVAEFIHGVPDDDTQADALGFVQQLLRA